MDKRAKVCMIIGVVLLLIGVGGFALGIAKVDDIEDGRPTFALEDVTNGTLSVLDQDGQGDLGFTFYVKGEFVDENDDGIWDHCDSTSVNVIQKPSIVQAEWSNLGPDNEGEFYYEIHNEGEECQTNRDTNKHFYFDNDSYIKLGRACYACGAGEFSFESNQSVYVINDDDWDIGPTIAVVIFGFIGGIGSLCCGVVFLLLGIIFIFTLKDETVQPMMMNRDGGFVIQQNTGSTSQVTQIATDETVLEPYSFPSTDDTESDTKKV